MRVHSFFRSTGGILTWRAPHDLVVRGYTQFMGFQPTTPDDSYVLQFLLLGDTGDAPALNEQHEHVLAALALNMEKLTDVGYVTAFTNQASPWLDYLLHEDEQVTFRVQVIQGAVSNGRFGLLLFYE